ncbi:MAG TPA: ADOP family duplicated permease [Vicinamibacterales bacterium]|nr:ADOP family duplicated permease [Vicinamibacterales bacterium]
MTPPHPRPPRLARWLLRLRPLGSRRSDVTADLEEIFAERVDHGGLPHARRRYYRDVISLWAWNVSGRRLAADAMQDLLHGLRVYRRNPGAVAITVVGLALAIAVSTSVFALLNASLLRPTGVSDPDSTVRVMRAFEQGTSTAWPYADYLTLREHARMPLEATLGDRARLSLARPAGQDGGESVPVAFVGEGFLRVFGARPFRGRILQPNDDAPGAAAVAVASYGFWRRTLGEDPNVAGRTIWLNGAPVTIVGVTPRWFTGFSDHAPALWAPFASYGVLYGGSPLTRTSAVGVNVTGRIPAGATREQAEAELSSVAAAAARPEPGLGLTSGVRLDPAGSRVPEGGPVVLVLVLTIVFVILGLIVLLACGNVANLQLASAIARRREIGLRIALGAARGRIVRQLVTESVALGIAAGLLGLLLALWLSPALAAVVKLPATVDLTPDARVFLFVTVVSIAAGIGAGLAPARQGAAGDIVTALKGDAPRQGSSRPGRTRSILIGVQAAASLVLIVVAALLTRATVRAAHVDIGFDAYRLAAVAPDFTRERYDASRSRAYWSAALERVRALPAVASASLASYSPYGGGRAVTNLNRNGTRSRVYSNDVLPDYFSTIGIRVVRGRTFTDGEAAGHAPVVMISETLARDFWPGQDPVGQSFAPFDGSNATVVGVVADAITTDLRERSAAAFYRPLGSYESARLVIRTRAAPEGAVPAIRDALRPLDPGLWLDVNLAATGLREQLEEPQILASLAGGLAVLALALAAVGIYGVTAFVTGQRTREIGVRVAVGASRADVLALLLRDSLRPVAIGMAAGMVVALIAGQLFAAVLYGVGPGDPLAFAAASGILFLSAAAAVFLPARRAAQVDPAFVLRQF